MINDLIAEMERLEYSDDEPELEPAVAMNNDPTSDLPDISGLRQPDWAFFDKVWNLDKDLAKSEDRIYWGRLARRELLRELEVLSRTRCAACWGFGHRARDCHTHARLSLLGSTSFAYRRLMAWGRGVAQMLLR